MKRLLTAAAVLMCLTAVPTFALDAPADRDGRTTAPHDRTTVIDDVIRMSQAGVSDDAIIKFLHESRASYVVDADVVIALTDARVSKAVINAVMDEAYARDDDGNDRRSTSRTTVYVRPSYVYDPWYTPYWYDPYWYGPRLSVGFGFGGYYGGYRGHVGGGHTGGGHWGGGGHGGGRGGRH